MTRAILLTAVVSLAAGACVTKGKYKGVKNQLAACETERDGLSTKLGAEQKRATDLESELVRLTGRAEAAEKEKGRLEVEKGRLEVELTQVVKDRTRLEASAAELTAALADARKRKAEADTRVNEYRSLLAKFRSLIDAGKLKVKISDGRMVLALPTDVLFASGKATLSDEGRLSIMEVGGILATIRGRRFQVEGHTDNVPIRTRKYPSNWELAAARALVVSDAMRAAGMPGGSLSAASYGEFRPNGSNDTPEGREANRRIEIVLVPNLSSLPGFEELRTAVGDS